MITIRHVCAAVLYFNGMKCKVNRYRAHVSVIQLACEEMMSAAAVVGWVAVENRMNLVTDTSDPRGLWEVIYLFGRNSGLWGRLVPYVS